MVDFEMCLREVRESKHAVIAMGDGLEDPNRPTQAMEVLQMLQRVECELERAKEMRDG